jgi:carbonic anhydrase/acetyltransferase-like protein (isoleucine patch superfamily)
MTLICPSLTGFALVLLLFTNQLEAGEQSHGRTSSMRSIVIRAGERVQDAVCIFCSIEVVGIVSGDAVAIAGSIDIRGSVHGDAVAVGGGIRVRRGGTLGEDAVAMGGPVVREEGSKIGGKVEGSPYFYFPGQRQVFLPGSLAVVAFSVALVLLGYPILRGRRVRAMSEILRRRPIAWLLAGVLVMASGAGVLTTAEFFGDWEDAVIYTILIVIGVLTILGFPGLSLVLGERILPRQATLVATLAGTLLAALLLLIPVAGLIFFSLGVIASCGAAVVSRFGTGRLISKSS